MKIKKGLLILYFIVIFSVSLLSLSWAEFRLTPSIGIRQEYNDNITLKADDEEADFITTVNPAVNLAYDTKLLSLSLDYGFLFRFFADNSERNETSLDETQKANLGTTISLYEDIFFIRISDVYERVTIDKREQVALGNIFVNLTDSNWLSINPYLEYPLSRTINTRIGYTYTNVWFRAKEGDDTQNHSATLDIAKQWTPQITTTLSYNFLVSDRKINEDFNRHNASLNLLYEVSPKLVFSGGVGQSWFDFDTSGSRTASIWNINANYLLTKTLSLGAAYFQSFSEAISKNAFSTADDIPTSTAPIKDTKTGLVTDSVTFGVFKSEGVSGNIYYNGKITANLGVFRNIDTFETTNREDESTGITLDSRIPVMPKMTGNITGSYAHFKFLAESEEKVDRYGIGLSFDYTLRITVLTLGYTYNQNDSTDNLKDYKNNIIWIRATFTI